MIQIDVSIIIVNYNTCQMTASCIDSIFANTQFNSFEVILVDNASLDESKEIFEKDSRIIYVYLEENVGFGRANNVGIDRSSGKYLFLLNSDTYLIGDVIKDLFDFVEKHGEMNIGALGTCLIDRFGNDILSFGRFLSPNRIYCSVFEKIGVCKSYCSQVYDRLKTADFAYVDHISGADLFIPSVILKFVGRFDPAFFMYYEETDLEKCMAEKGYNRVVINSRKIVHLEGGSFKKQEYSPHRKALMTKSLVLYIQKHFTGILKYHIWFLMLLVTLKDLFETNYSFRDKLGVLKLLF